MNTFGSMYSCLCMCRCVYLYVPFGGEYFLSIQFILEIETSKVD